MKVSIVAHITTCAFGCLLGWSAWRFGDVVDRAENQLSIAGLSLERHRHGDDLDRAPQRLSTAWLLQFDRQLDSADDGWLRDWSKTRKDLSPVVYNFASMLVGARLREIEAPESLATEISESVVPDLVRFFSSGELAHLPQFTGVEATKLLDALRSEHPARVFEVENAHGSEVIDSSIKRKIFDALTDTNPTLAIKLAQQLGRNMKRETMRGIMTRWADQDLAAATEWALSLEPSRARSAWGQNLLSASARQDPAGTLANMDPFETLGYEVPDAKKHVLGLWLKQDSEAAIDWVEAQENPGCYALAVISHLSKTDIESAEQWLAQVPEASVDHVLYRMAVQSNAQNAQATMAWAKNLEDPRHRHQALGQLALDIVHKDAPQAWSVIHGLMTEQTEEHSASSVIAPTLKYLEDQSPGFLKEKDALSLLRSYDPDYFPDIVLEKLAESDPAMVANIITNRVNHKRAFRAAYALMRSWTLNDPAAASEWVAGLPLGKVRDHAQDSLMSSLPYTDPGAAVEWVAAHLSPGTKAWVDIQGRFAQRRAEHGDYAQALNHIEQITEEKERYYDYRSVFGTWLNHDPSAARRAFKALEIAPEYRMKLEEQVFHGLPPIE